MNSHQRRKRRRFWERAFKRFNALAKQVYGQLIPRLLDTPVLFPGATYCVPERRSHLEDA